MDFLTAVHTDVGIKKSTNQDSVLIQIADTDYGEVTFAVVCDGMGGLAKGELASATVIRKLSEWFGGQFSQLLYGGMDENALRHSWENVVFSANDTIQKYGRLNNVNLGTTLAMILIVQERYYVMNIGDSRVYKISDGMYQITKDQTYVQREMDAGRMTPEQAKKDPKRNVLLQCIGASAYIEPDFMTGQVSKGEVYMLCSDGFRHIISNEEFYEKLNPMTLMNEQIMKENLEYLTELNKYRREEDNISAIAIKTY